jgi:hypothetical protein
MIDRLTIFVASMLLSACSREVPSTEVLGNFTLTQYRDVPFFDLDASHTPATRATLCGETGQTKCLLARSFITNIFQNDEFSWLVVDAFDEAKLENAARFEHAKGSYVFNLKTGQRVTCSGCGWEKYRLSATFMYNGEILIVGRVQALSGQSSMELAQINGILASKLAVAYQSPPNSEEGWGSPNYVSPSQKALAWFECGDTCKLYWVSGELDKVYSQDTACNKGGFIPYWEGDVPKIAQEPQTRLLYCLDAEGKRIYPLVNHTAYLFGKSATAADIVPERKDEQN